MNAAVNRSTPAKFQLQINNTSGGTITAYITTPTLNFGNQLPTLDQTPLFSSGGPLTGLLSHSFASSTIPGDKYLDLPLSSNYFEIANTGDIHRVNYLTRNRFPKGSVITLLFNHPGVRVLNSAYLNLIDGYTSVANGSLTLLSGSSIPVKVQIATPSPFN